MELEHYIFEMGNKLEHSMKREVAYGKEESRYNYEFRRTKFNGDSKATEVD